MAIKKHDEYENGDITLMVYEVDDHDVHYWLRAGVALLQLDTEQFNDLYTLVNAYVREGQFVQDVMTIRGGERNDG